MYTQTHSQQQTTNYNKQQLTYSNPHAVEKHADTGANMQIMFKSFTGISIHPYIYTAILPSQVGLGGNTLWCSSALEKHLDLRFREVEDHLGIPAHNAVCDRVVFSVYGLGEGERKKSRILKVVW